MFANDLFKRFCRERNIKESTARSYESSLKSYVKFHNLSIDELIDEARVDEELKIPLKDRRIKKRLMDYRSFLLESKITPNTIKTYFTKIKTFYAHFEIEMPNLPDARYNREYEINYLDLPTKEHIKQALEIVPLTLRRFCSLSVQVELQGRKPCHLLLAISYRLHGTIIMEVHYLQYSTHYLKRITSSLRFI